jgi:hypothetical protein
MFGKKKDFTDFVIRKYEGQDIYYSAPEYVDGVQKGEKERDQLLKEKFVKIWNHNIPNLEQYYAQAESHEWNKREKRFIIRGYNINYEYYLKSEIEALGFVPLTKNYENMIGVLDVKYYHIYNGGGYYVSPIDLKRIEKAVETEQKPLVLKGTDWPYWFKIDGELIPSTTSNWFNYLYTDRKIITEKMLEVYTGPDKYEGHRNECK